MTDEQKEFLRSLGVKDKDLESCIIDGNSTFIPTYNDEGEIIATAQENYNNCKPPEPQPSEMGILQQQVKQLTEEKLILAQNVLELTSVVEAIVLGGTV